MRLLFCCDPLDPRRPDASYEAEIAAAGRLGIPHSLINFEALIDGHDPDRAVRSVTPAPDGGEIGIFRGWMLTIDQYTDLYGALADRRVKLINSPAQYKHCHELPDWYGWLEGQTPHTVWTPAEDVSLARLMVLLGVFGDKPVIVKDYVKSCKHQWLEACFIPSARDTDAVKRVVTRFLELQRDNLCGGLVFREFVEFEQAGEHSQSGMPMVREYRLFFVDGEMVHMSHYWNQGDYEGEMPTAAHFTRLAAHIKSRFFTMDVAKTKSGEWLVVELGDAQVAELPSDAEPAGFFARVSDVPASKLRLV